MKNIVFDLGNVILKFDPEKILSSYNLSEEDKELFKKRIFCNPLWRECDRGKGYYDTLFLEETEKLPPHLRSVFYGICGRYDMFQRFFPVTEGIKELVTELKDRGYKIYLLSNISLYYHNYVRHSDILPLFDGLFPSCDYGLIKPEREIYETFFRTFSLTPSECIFIDDRPENVRGSIEAGMPAISFNALYEDIKSLRLKLSAAGINVSL